MTEEAMKTTKVASIASFLFQQTFRKCKLVFISSANRLEIKLP